ncbi:Uncharacterized conserved protein [uncultured Flavonifractor sp.]|nr:Uncharacterized conserved protein [uncultured Flavonifractor sp.]
MKQKHNHPYTILDAEYQVIDGAEHANGSVQSGSVFITLGLAALGIATLFFPVAVGAGFAFVIATGIFLFGLSQIILFFQESGGQRGGWSLANGILLLVAAGLNLGGALFGEVGIVQMIAYVSFAMGFLTMSVGLNQLTGALAEKKGTSGRRWALLSGGLNLLLSVFMFVNPVISWFTWTTVWGIYLLTASIALLVTLWSAKRRPFMSSAL